MYLILVEKFSYPCSGWICDLMWNIMWKKTLDYQNDDFAIFPKNNYRDKMSKGGTINFATQEFNVNCKTMRQSLNKHV